MILIWSARHIRRCIVSFLCMTIVSAAIQATAASQSKWVTCSPLPTLNSLYGVAWTGSKIVVTGDHGTVLTSSDGDRWENSWITHSPGDAIDLRQFASSGKEMVVAGNVADVVWTSTDGLLWTPRSTGSGGIIHKLNYSGGKYVGLASTGSGRSPGSVILTSIDGVKWEVQTISNSGLSLHNVVWTGKHYVAIGRKDSGWEILKFLMGKSPKIDAMVITVSIDGRSWATSELPRSGFGQDPRAITWTGTTLVIVCEDGMIYTSSDGTEWASQKGSPTNVNLTNVVWTGGQLVAVGMDKSKGSQGKAAILTSPDGSTWTKTTSAEGAANLNSVVWAGSQFVAVGYQGQIQVSSNGDHWVRKSPIGAAGNLAKVTSNGTILVAVGKQTAVTSSDGRQWIPHAVPDDFETSSVTWNGTHFVAVGAKGVVFTSSDGEHWNPENSETKADLKDIIWTGKEMICVGIDKSVNPSVGVVLKSVNGIKWSRCPIPPSVGGLCAIIWTGQQLFVVAHSGSVLTSSDGDLWVRQRRVETRPIIEDLAWSGKTFVAVGRASSMTEHKTILCSDDGVTWTSHLGPGAGFFYGITWAGDRFFAVGEGGMIFVSDDGFTWTYDSTVNDQSLDDVYWDGKTAYAVARGGTVISTTPAR